MQSLGETDFGNNKVPDNALCHEGCASNSGVLNELDLLKVGVVVTFAKHIACQIVSTNGGVQRFVVSGRPQTALLLVLTH
jgi:hypothetical protein